jgi:hypothetical protein
MERATKSTKAGRKLLAAAHEMLAFVKGEGAVAVVHQFPKAVKLRARRAKTKRPRKAAR